MRWIKRIIVVILSPELFRGEESRTNVFSPDKSQRFFTSFRMTTLLLMLITTIFFFITCELPTPPEEYENPIDPEVIEEEGIETPALVFAPDSVTIDVGASVTIWVYAIEVDSLAGSHIELHYDKNKLSVLSINPGEFFPGSLGIMFLNEDDPGTGTIDIYTSFLGSDSAQVSGTGSLANIVFTATSTGKSTLRYSDASELVDSDDNPIKINGFLEGVINAR